MQKEKRLLIEFNYINAVLTLQVRSEFLHGKIVCDNRPCETWARNNLYSRVNISGFMFTRS